MRRSPILAVAAAAVCGALAFSSTASAQSTTLGQLKSVVYASQQAVTALPAGPTVRPVNAADFKQHWDRDLVSPNVFRFQRQGFNACLRVPDNVAASQIAPITLASCSGTRAQWRRTSSPGVGDLYVNVATGHRMGPVFFVGDTVADKLTAYPGSIAFNPPFLNWAFEAL
jgi:hypothetical protein